MRFKLSIKRYLILIFIAICLQAGAVTQVFAQSLLCLPLDTFTNSPQTAGGLDLTNGAPGPLNIVDDGSPGVIGSFRNIEFGPLTGFGATLLIEVGIMSLSNDVSSTAPVSILYNANGAGLNLDLSNEIALALNLINNDHTGVSANMILTDSGNNTANFEIVNLPNTGDGDTLPTRTEFPIASFIGIGSLDLSNIRSIEFEITPTQPNSDISFRSFDNCLPYIPPAPVPTFSNWVLIALTVLLGIVGLVVIRRKKAAVKHF